MANKLSIDSQTSQVSLDTGEVPKAVLDKGYTLGKILGSGAFSKVYEASNNSPEFVKKYGKVSLACKRFDLLNADQEVWRDKCLKQEMKIMMKLRHANITRAYEVIKTRKAAFIFMKLSKNGNIGSYLEKTGKPIEESKAKKWFHDILSAVNYLHDRGVAHRDIKPENFLLDNDFRDAMLTDFGFSCIAVDKQKLLKGTACGTDPYKAPEIVILKAGHVYDPIKVDIWALGVSLFEMLNNCKPFGSDIQNPQRFVTKQKTRDYHFNKKVKMSEKALECCNSLLEPKPDKRPTAEQIMSHNWFKN